MTTGRAVGREHSAQRPTAFHTLSLNVSFSEDRAPCLVGFRREAQVFPIPVKFGHHAIRCFALLLCRLTSRFSAATSNLRRAMIFRILRCDLRFDV